MQRHVILEGKPTAGKTEISELFKIFFPGRVRILPELTTTLVRAHSLNILRDRRQLNELLREAVPARERQVRELIETTDLVLLEESHMGVHWAYSRILDDRFFLELYEEELAAHVLLPDRFVRLELPVELSVRRQKARATADVEVDGDLVRRTFEELDGWHARWGHDRLVHLDADRSPEIVVRDLIDLLGLEYGS